jgi:hypothetical protein
MPSMKWSSVASLRRAAIAAAMSCSSIPAITVDAVAADLVVRYDQSQLIRLPRPVSDVIIGNPSIADVTVQGGNLLVVTGKTFGITNIIALDAQRNVIQDQRVVVEAEDRRTLVLHKGALRETYTCSPTCMPTIVVGDNPLYFDVVSKAAQSRTSSSQPNAGAPQGSQE